MPEPPDVRAAARAACHECLAAALRAGVPDEAFTETARAGGCEVVVIVRPLASARPDPASDVDLAVLSILRSLTSPITTSGVLRELRLRGLDYGEATVKRSLARLVKRGRATNRKQHPRGYSSAG